MPVEDSARPILAALANQAVRDVFARIALGESLEHASAAERRALAQLETAGLIRAADNTWVVDEDRLRRLLRSGARPARPKSGPERFLTPDERIDRYPSRHDERVEFLSFVAPRVLRAQETLTEAEINDRLSQLTDDVALLRRMLVDDEVIERDPAGTSYRLRPRENGIRAGILNV